MYLTTSTFNFSKYKYLSKNIGKYNYFVKNPSTTTTYFFLSSTSKYIL